MQNCVFKLLDNKGFFNDLIYCDSCQKIKEKFFGQGIWINDDEAREVALYLVDQIQKRSNFRNY